MPLMLAALLLSAPPPESREAAERARARVITACHIPADRLVIEHDGDPPSYTITLKGSAPLSAARLACFADHLTDARGDFVGFAIEDEHVGAAYDRMRRHNMVTGARAMLRQLGLYGRLPTFHRRHESLRAFAVRLERLCTALPHSVLRVVDGAIMIRDDSPAHPTARQTRRWLCVTSAAILTGHDPITVPQPPVTYVDLPNISLPENIHP